LSTVAGKAHFADPTMLTIASTLFNDSTIKRLFVETEKSPRGKYTVNVTWEGKSEPVTIDDMIPVLGASSEPEAAFGTVGDKNEMWFHLWLKAVAKMVGGYANIFTTDTTAITPYTQQAAEALVPGADAQQVAALAPVLQLNKLARAIVPADQMSDEDLIQGLGTSMVGASVDDIAPKAGAGVTPDLIVNVSQLPTWQTTVHVSDFLVLEVMGIVPEDLVMRVTSISGNETIYEATDGWAQIEMDETDSPYEIVCDSVLEPHLFKECEFDLDYLPENMTLQQIQ
jgi:hypothetical protein